MTIRNILIAAGLWLVLTAGPACASPLITAAEAALPPAPVPPPTRGIGRGPGISVLSPDPAADTSSPVDLKIRFDAHSGQTIDGDSVKVTYIKTPSIDLTSRLGSFITKEGIHVPRAEVPPGEHVLRVTVKDSAGRETAKYIAFRVRP